MKNRQLQFVRDAMLIFSKFKVERYKDVSTLVGYDDVPWSEIAVAIDEETQVKIGHERLRQFVVGNPIKNFPNLWEFPELKKEGLDAVINFLCSEIDENNNPLISIEDLDSIATTGDSIMRASLAMVQYWRSGSEETHTADDRWKSSCILERRHGELISILKLDASAIKVPGPVSCNLEEVIFTEEGYVNWRKAGFTQRHKYQSEHYAHDAWGLISPERLMMIFTRHSRFRINKVWTGIARNGENHQRGTFLIIQEHQTTHFSKSLSNAQEIEYPKPLIFKTNLHLT